MAVLVCVLFVAAVLYGAVNGAPLPDFSQAPLDSQSGDDDLDDDKSNQSHLGVPEWIGIGLGVVIFIVVLVLVVTAVLVLILVFYQRNKVKRKLSENVNERITDEEIERENAKKAVNYYMRLTKRYLKDDMEPCPPALPDMGSRMQKYWFQLTDDSRVPGSSVLTIAAISENCPLDLSQETTRDKLMKLFKSMHEMCRFIHPIQEIGYLDDRKQVIIIQPFMPRGSLKDLIHKEQTPAKDWSEKYPSVSSGSEEIGLSREQVANYGYQILKAMRFLYKTGFSNNILGHVHSGNIFVSEDGVCRLGGYENTLLGYRSRFYRMCKDQLDHMDVIMFGHLVFEMSCGYELITEFPTEEDYQAVKDDDIKDLLRSIFADGYPHSIKDIKKFSFFKSGKKDVTKFGDIFKELKQKLSSVLPKPEVLKEVCSRVTEGHDKANEHADMGAKRKFEASA